MLQLLGSYGDVRTIMKKPRKQPSIVFYDGIAHKVGEMPDQLVEDVMVERWARRMFNQRVQGSSWFTIRLRTWFELGMDDHRLLHLMTQRAQKAFKVLQLLRAAAIKARTSSEGK
jgi:hypothetical protein